MRAQRVAATTAAVGIVAVCCAAGISAGSASPSGSIGSAKAVPDPGVSQTAITRTKHRSNATGNKAEAGHTRADKAVDAQSSKLRVREVFSASEKQNSLTLRDGHLQRPHRAC